ncbi:50S ribosomal protein L32 [Desulfurivibrio alkaliphilus]|uniref:Large ribosomal subunit protein bL32 n=1 Tax=Desulfurivibrio alkaliphilus (strain DSM 19089 / UNIQEM U267 / AHT2) TaxID=589865 RepID=D6Z362_DESAT|nr:50S ribosomal protein L32 [Desulfurivibrio alkaliphilus]ADH85987.1 ribosomal protein L32 [Desulfurivibrio alkaliphilus AHT 2]
MALPKKRKSHSRTRTRRAHDALSGPSVAKCAECGEPKLPHRLCPGCGSYKGRAVIKLDAE